MSARELARRRALKNRAKRALAHRRDYLAEFCRPRWRAAWVLGSLRGCAMRAGWSAQRIAEHIYPMAERIPACVMHGRRDAAALAEVDSWK